jgi:thioester reductase-like protein
MEEFKYILGGRMRAMTTGGAPTSQAVVDFLRVCFKCPVYNGYASTECGSIAWIDLGKQGDDFNMKYNFDNVDIKLVDVPELGYTSKDQPFPRGEVCVKSDQCIPGYYRDTERTKELIDSNGFYHTGDIGEMQENGRLRIIDRKKNIFKLAQGEYVAPEPLENKFLSSEYIDQIFLYGDSLKSFLVAVVVPNVAIIKQVARDHNIAYNSDEELCKICNDITCALYKTILKDIARVGVEAKMPSYEIPRALLIDFEKFTIDNGRLTGPSKISRIGLTKYYLKKLQTLYEDLENGGDDGGSLLMAITSALSGVINTGSDTTAVDSLSATRISAILANKLGLQVSAKDLLNKNMNVVDLVNMIQNHEETKLDLKKEVDSLDDTTIVPFNIANTVVAPELVSNILLTGGTGYLGGALIEELLRRKTNAKIYCIVRGKDDQHVRERLFAHLQNAVGLAPQVFQDRVIAVRGDLSRPRLGVTDDVWEYLCREIDVVYHNGAHVNFLLAYEELKATNAASCVELLRMCVAGGKLKPLHFVSTIGVLGYVRHQTTENTPLESIVSEDDFRKLQGYSQSKMVAELVLERAKKRGIPISIFRPELIHGHSRTGYANNIEWISRFIIGVIRMGIAPITSAAIHLASVDFVASVIVDLTLRNSNATMQTLTRFNAVNTVNLNLDRDAHITVDKLIDHIVSFGYKLERVPYEQWVKHLNMLLAQSDQNPILPIANMFPSQGFPGSYNMGDLLGTANLRQGLEGSGIQCISANDEAMTHRYLKFFVEHGDVEAPNK